MSNFFSAIVLAISSKLPEVKSAKAEGQKRPDFQERMVWTSMALVTFLMMCQIPVYGIRPPKSSDPFYWMRMVLAANKGTLMEFGISPIVTASMIIQLAQSAGILSRKGGRSDELVNACQRCLSLFITLLEVVAYIFSGMYGDVAELGPFTCLLIIVQLLIAGVICQLLSEILTKGWGFGRDGISLFIACNLCETILWKCFSPVTLNVGQGTEFEGALTSLVYLLITRTDKSRALREAFYRPQLPNVTNLLATLLVFVIVVFVQGFYVPFRVQHKRSRDRFEYPIKLFYTSNQPIIFHTALLSNVFFFSKLFYRRFGNSNFLVRLLGTWEENEYSGGVQNPIGGLAYFLSPPGSVFELASDPMHAILYISITLASCALISRMWVEFSGQSSGDIADQLRGEYVLPGYQETGSKGGDRLEEQLNRYIPTAAAFGGLCVGVLSVSADFLGAIGSGTGILLATSILQDLASAYKQESRPGGQVQEQGFLRRL